MSAISIEHEQQVEHVVNQLVAALHGKYPYISPEIIYSPPDEGDAWVVLHGAADGDELEQIRDYGRDITAPALENEGVFVLMLSGNYRDSNS